MDFIHEYFYIVDVTEKGSSIEELLDGVKEHNVDNLVIDPWNELDAVRGNLSETDWTGAMLSKIRRHGRVNDYNPWIVAHPTKMYKRDDGTYPVPTLYDISGSAHWYNKADNGLVVYRVNDTDEVELHVQKVKYKYYGKKGFATVYYQYKTGQYEETRTVPFIKNT